MNKRGSMIGIITGITVLIIGIAMKVMEPFAVSVAGGADGPTAVFFAGKVGSDISGILLVAGIVLVVLSVVVRKAGK